MAGDSGHLIGQLAPRRAGRAAKAGLFAEPGLQPGLAQLFRQSLQLNRQHPHIALPVILTFGQMCGHGGQPGVVIGHGGAQRGGLLPAGGKLGLLRGLLPGGIVRFPGQQMTGPQTVKCFPLGPRGLGQRFQMRQRGGAGQDQGAIGWRAKAQHRVPGGKGGQQGGGGGWCGAIVLRAGPLQHDHTARAGQPLHKGGPCGGVIGMQTAPVDKDQIKPPVFEAACHLGRRCHPRQPGKPCIMCGIVQPQRLGHRAIPSPQSPRPDFASQDHGLPDTGRSIRRPWSAPDPAPWPGAGFPPARTGPGSGHKTATLPDKARARKQHAQGLRGRL